MNKFNKYADEDIKIITSISTILRRTNPFHFLEKDKIKLSVDIFYGGECIRGINYKTSEKDFSLHISKQDNYLNISVEYDEYKNGATVNYDEYKNGATVNSVTVLLTREDLDLKFKDNYDRVKYRDCVNSLLENTISFINSIQEAKNSELCDNEFNEIRSLVIDAKNQAEREFENIWIDNLDKEIVQSRAKDTLAFLKELVENEANIKANSNDYYNYYGILKHFNDEEQVIKFNFSALISNGGFYFISTYSEKLTKYIRAQIELFERFIPYNQDTSWFFEQAYSVVKDAEVFKELKFDIEDFVKKMRAKELEEEIATLLNLPSEEDN